MRGSGAKHVFVCKLVFCAAGGLLATVLIAASCLFYSTCHPIGAHRGVSSDDALGRAPGSVSFHHGQLSRGFGYREWMNYWTWIPEPSARQAKGSIEGAGVCSVESGWPLIAFESPPDEFPASCDNAGWQAAMKKAVMKPAAADSVPGFLKVTKYRKWPTRPVVGGLVLDSLVYSALIGGVVFGVPAARKSVRRRGRRCEACGYPVAGLSRCPECGDEVVRPSGARDSNDADHGFRDAQGGVAPPVATNHRPSGAPESSGAAGPYELEAAV